MGFPFKIQAKGGTRRDKYDRLWRTLKKNLSLYKLIKDYGVDKAQLHRLRKNIIVKTMVLNKLCHILDSRIEDIMEYVPDEMDEKLKHH
jgi:putative transcriptional regulator